MTIETRGATGETSEQLLASVQRIQEEAHDDPDQAHSSSNPAALRATITYGADGFDFTA